MALLSPQDRECLLGRQLRADALRGAGRLRHPHSGGDCVLCPLEEVPSWGRQGSSPRSHPEQPTIAGMA